VNLRPARSFTLPPPLSASRRRSVCLGAAAEVAVRFMPLAMRLLVGDLGVAAGAATAGWGGVSSTGVVSAAHAYPGHNGYVAHEPALTRKGTDEMAKLTVKARHPLTMAYSR
jgi:hypothetical protein